MLDCIYLLGLYTVMPRLAWLALVPCLLLSGCFSAMSSSEVMGSGHVTPKSVALDAVTLPLQVVGFAVEGTVYYGGKALSGPSREQVMASFKADLAKNPMVIKDREWLSGRNRYYLFGVYVESDDNKFSREQLDVMAAPGFLKNGQSMAPRLLVRNDLPPDLRIACIDQVFARCRAEKAGEGTIKCEFWRDDFEKYLCHPDIVARFRDECPHERGMDVRNLLHLDALIKEQANLAERLAANPDEMLQPGWLDSSANRFFARRYALTPWILGSDIGSISAKWGKQIQREFPLMAMDERHLRVLAKEATSRVGDDPADRIAFTSMPTFETAAAQREILSLWILRRKDCPVDVKTLLQDR